MLQRLDTPLARKATLCLVSTSCYTARRLDKRVTTETNERYHADPAAGRFNKLILPAECLKELTEIIGEARTLFYSLTLPWCDEGPRVLPNANYSKFADAFRPLQRKFDAAADKFARAYPDYVEESKKLLNGMWKAEDYPSPAHIRGKFQLKMQILPFPDSSDFRADLDDDTLADIKAEIEASSSTDTALKNVGERITEVVGHMAKKLAEYRGKDYQRKPGETRSFFTDSLVENVRELADLLPAFNLTDDPKLNEIAARISKELCVEDADTLRENGEARKSVQKSADEIVSDVQKFFG